MMLMIMLMRMQNRGQGHTKKMRFKGDEGLLMGMRMLMQKTHLVHNRGTYDANDHADADAKQRSGPYKKN